MTGMGEASIPKTIQTIIGQSNKAFPQTSNDDGTLFRFDEAKEFFKRNTGRESDDENIRRRVWLVVLSEGKTRRIVAGKIQSPGGSESMGRKVIITHSNIMLIGGTNPDQTMTFDRRDPMVSRLVSHQLLLSAAEQAEVRECQRTLSAEDTLCTDAQKNAAKYFQNLHFLTTMIALLIATRAVPEPDLTDFSRLYKKWKSI